MNRTKYIYTHMHIHMCDVIYVYIETEREDLEGLAPVKRSGKKRRTINLG